MQACPYDALYIDPASQTAAKCNYCAHRTEQGLQPACVIVCPEQAIISGDLDNPLSEIARLVAREQTSVRKPEQGTRPKLYYLGADAAALTPSVAQRGSSYLWAERPNENGPLALSKPLIDVAPSAPQPARAEPASNGEAPEKARPPGRLARIREVYDVYHAQPWGRKVSGYLWTKSIAAGALLAAALASLLGPTTGNVLNLAAPALALLFLALTTALLVLDLKRPERFLYVLFKPNPKSWLVIGSWILIAYGGLAALWLIGGATRADWLDLLRWPAAVVAIGVAGYSAFLFAQAQGRDFWQSPLLLPQLITAALVAGSASLLAIASLNPARVAAPSAQVPLLTIGLVVTGLVLFAELYTPHANADVAHAARLLTEGALAPVFWGGAVFIGIVVPLGLLYVSRGTPGPFALLASLAALVGLLIYEDLWVQAGQSAPLS
jgi:formate-dependent nitrite reductase membrane component NrfD